VAVEITDSMVEQAKELIKNIWSEIKNLKFERLPERDENKCSRCDFDDICWGR
jgi:radical SAM protein with 4Fe4S-binding SPASM domain